MKALVLGAGVIGVTSAYYLAKAGWEVTVIERQDGVALETSFGNAGEVSPGYSAPWAAPGVPLKALGWLFQRHAPVILRPRFDSALIFWLGRMLARCNREDYNRNKIRMFALAEYSRSELERLRGELGISYDQRSLGTMQLFRTETQRIGAAMDISILEQMGVTYQQLSADECVAIEPGLAYAKVPIVGALRLPGDETGDCHKFTIALAEQAKALGVTFRFGTSVDRLVSHAGTVREVITSAGPYGADIVVLATASYTPALVGPLGIKLPVYPVKGYSLTAAIENMDRAPLSTVIDETYKAAVTRLGDRVRVAGMAELAGFDLRLPEGRRRTLELCASSLFDGVCDFSQATFWTGLRPMTPDGPPVIGRTSLSNLYVNTGHGTLGWTMSCGSAALLADIVSGQKPALSEQDYSVSRFARN